jgi:hypothetical protein
MTPDVRQRWAGEILRQASGAWTGQVTFDVVGVQSSGDALAALASAPYFLAVNAGNPPTHPKSSLMYLESLVPADAGFFHWIITANYSSSPLGFHPNPGNPLNDPATYTWHIGTQSEPIDVDTYGNPIINAALDAFQRSPNDEQTILELVITRNEPIFNPLTAIKYMNCVNKTQMIVLGIWPVAEGIALCRNIAPMGEASKLSPFTPVRYVFAFKRPYSSTQDSDGLWDSWKERILNEGIRGYWLNGSTITMGDFCYNSDSVRVNSDIRLDPSGIPMDPATFGIATLGGHQAAVAAPRPLPSNVIVQALPTIGTPNAYILKYQTKGLADFGELNL